MVEAGEHRAGSPAGRRNPPSLTHYSFLPPPHFDSSWSGSSAIASAALPGPVPHAEQFLKEKAFPDICCEFAALLLLHHQFTPRSSPAPPPSPPVPSYQSSPARADDLRGELMTPHLFQSCSSPCSFSLMLTQDFALCNVTEQPDPTQANHLRVHFLSLVQVFPTRTTGLSTTYIKSTFAGLNPGPGSRFFPCSFLGRSCRNADSSKAELCLVCFEVSRIGNDFHNYLIPIGSFPSRSASGVEQLHNPKNFLHQKYTEENKTKKHEIFLLTHQ